MSTSNLNRTTVVRGTKYLLGNAVLLAPYGKRSERIKTNLIWPSARLSRYSRNSESEWAPNFFFNLFHRFTLLLRIQTFFTSFFSSQFRFINFDFNVPVRTTKLSLPDRFVMDTSFQNSLVIFICRTIMFSVIIINRLLTLLHTNRLSTHGKQPNVTRDLLATLKTRGESEQTTSQAREIKSGMIFSRYFEKKLCR